MPRPVWPKYHVVNNIICVALSADFNVYLVGTINDVFERNFYLCSVPGKFSISGKEGSLIAQSIRLLFS